MLPLCSWPARIRFSRTVSCGKDLQQLKRAAHAQPVEIARPHAGHRAAVEMHIARARPQLSEDAVEQASTCRCRSGR